MNSIEELIKEIRSFCGLNPCEDCPFSYDDDDGEPVCPFNPIFYRKKAPYEDKRENVLAEVGSDMYSIFYTGIYFLVFWRRNQRVG